MLLHGCLKQHEIAQCVTKLSLVGMQLPDNMFSGSCISTNECLFILLAQPTLAKTVQCLTSRFPDLYVVSVNFEHSLSKHGLETPLKSLFYLFVRVYAVLCTVHGQ